MNLLFDELWFRRPEVNGFVKVSADKLYGYAMELVDRILAKPEVPESIKSVLTKIKGINQFDEKGQGVEYLQRGVSPPQHIFGRCDL